MKTQFPKTIGKFTRYDTKPNAIQYGALYTQEVRTDMPYEKKRILRVYLPEDFSFDKEYSVIYMSDVQNIVDRYTSAYGEWDIDEHIHNLLLEGYPSFIVVGIDCPKKGHMHRVREYTIPKFKKINLDFTGPTDINPYGEIYAAYLVNKIMPEIKATFPIKTDRNSTAFGGSSMGGLLSFDIVSIYKDIFGFSLCFSPACALFEEDEYASMLEGREYDLTQKYYIYCGGKDLDEYLLGASKGLYEYLSSKGFDENHLALNIDEEAGHNEPSWSKHFEEAIKFWFK